MPNGKATKTPYSTVRTLIPRGTAWLGTVNRTALLDSVPSSSSLTPVPLIKARGVACCDVRKGTTKADAKLERISFVIGQSPAQVSVGAIQDTQNTAAYLDKVEVAFETCLEESLNVGHGSLDVKPRETMSGYSFTVLNWR